MCRRAAEGAIDELGKLGGAVGIVETVERSASNIVEALEELHVLNGELSQGAEGEAKMAELIASLDLSLFVMDYDYNAPNAEHLWRTHEKFFNIIRQAHPKLPIVIFSRVTNATDERTQAVRRTYENARKNGDNYVWFVDGRDLMKGVDSSYTSVDGTHPNDLGFYAMYKNALPVIEEALKSSDEPIGK